MLVAMYVKFGEYQQKERRKTNHIWDHIKEAGTSLSSGSIALPDEILLGMTCHLGRSSGYDIVTRDSTPISFTQPLETN